MKFCKTNLNVKNLIESLPHRNVIKSLKSCTCCYYNITILKFQYNNNTAVVMIIELILQSKHNNTTNAIYSFQCIKYIIVLI